MSPTNQSDWLAAWREQVKEFTLKLRSGSGSFMERLREILAEKNLDPQKTACLEGFDDFLESYCGLLVLEDGQAISFGLDFREGFERNASLIMWERIPDSDLTFPGLIAAGRELLKSERS